MSSELLLFYLETETHASFINPVLAKAINLAIFLTFLYFILRKPMAQFFRDRAEGIRAQLKRAEREKQEALAKLKEVEERLSKLDSEVARIRTEAEREAEAEYQRVIAGANEDAEKLRQLARREIEAAAKTARLELKAFVAEKTVELAESIIKREIRDEDDNRLITDYVKELEEVGR